MAHGQFYDYEGHMGPGGSRNNFGVQSKLGGGDFYQYVGHFFRKESLLYVK